MLQQEEANYHNKLTASYFSLLQVFTNVFLCDIILATCLLSLQLWSCHHPYWFKYPCFGGLRRWLSDSDCFLPFQRTQVQFSTPKLGISQQSTAPSPGDLIHSFGLYRNPHSCDMYLYIHHKNKTKGKPLLFETRFSV